MLKASNFDAVDNVFSFLGALIDALCGLCHTAEVRNKSTERVDRVNVVLR